MNEKEVVRQVRNAALFHGYQVDDMSQPRRSMMPKGLPDMRVRHPKRKLRIWIETKDGDNNLSADQLAWHRLESECGGMVATLRSGAEAHDFFTDLHRAHDAGECLGG